MPKTFYEIQVELPLIGWTNVGNGVFTDKTCATNLLERRRRDHPATYFRLVEYTGRVLQEDTQQ